MSKKLAAINSMLRAIGESPVSSLTSGVPEAETAETFLSAVTSEVLALGWSCNVDEKSTLTPNNNGQIILADTILSLTTVGRDRWRSVSPRRDLVDGLRKLFDRDANTFKWSGPVLCRTVHLLDYEDLTQGLQRYISEEAALRLQADVLGSASLDARRKERAGMALAALQDEEAANDRTNILTDSPHCVYIAGRNHVLFGR